MQVYGPDGTIYEGTPGDCEKMIAIGYKSRPYAKGEKYVSPKKKAKK